METASTEVASIRCRNNTKKSTGRTHQYFVDFGSQTHVETMSYFHVDSPFKINEISANIQRGNSTLNRWQIDEYVSIGLQRAWVDLQVDKNWTWSFRSCFSIPLVWFYHFYLFPPFVCFFRLYPNFYLSSDQSKTMKIAKFYYGERNFIFELNGKWSTKYKSINHYFLSQNYDIPW